MGRRDRGRRLAAPRAGGAPRRRLPSHTALGAAAAEDAAILRGRTGRGCAAVHRRHAATGRALEVVAAQSGDCSYCRCLATNPRRGCHGKQRAAPVLGLPLGQQPCWYRGRSEPVLADLLAAAAFFNKVSFLFDFVCFALFYSACDFFFAIPDRPL